MNSSDTSGTDDDHPPPQHHGIPLRGSVVGNGRAVANGSVRRFPRISNDSAVEAQIHHLEQEAYCSILRAFKAQADAISWEKESLICELRKELRLSNEEHRELLGRVNADDIIHKIRDQRHQGMQNGGHPIHEQFHEQLQLNSS